MVLDDSNGNVSRVSQNPSGKVKKNNQLYYNSHLEKPFGTSRWEPYIATRVVLGGRQWP